MTMTAISHRDENGNYVPQNTDAEDLASIPIDNSALLDTMMLALTLGAYVLGCILYVVAG